MFFFFLNFVRNIVLCQIEKLLHLYSLISRTSDKKSTRPMRAKKSVGSEEQNKKRIMLISLSMCSWLLFEVER